MQDRLQRCVYEAATLVSRGSPKACTLPLRCGCSRTGCGPKSPAEYNLYGSGLHAVAVRCGAPLVVCIPEREASERPLVAPAARRERLGHVERHAVVRVPWVTVLKLAGHLNHECCVGGGDDRVALPRARLALSVPVGPGPPVAEPEAGLADRLSRRPRHGATS